MKKNVVPATAVIFDMDGVIADTMSAHFYAWKKTLKKTGINVTRHDVYKREGQRGATSVVEILNEFGLPCSPARARRLLAQKEAMFRRNVVRRYIPGSRRFIRGLKRQGMPLGLVTGTSRQEVLKILPAALVDLFDVVVTANDVKNGKPNPAPYRRALKKMKAKARDVLVVENAPLGIRSAKSAGCRCFALRTSLPRRYLRQADGVFDSFRDLERRIRILAAQPRKKK